ncbi:MAG: 30S ribosomal protein S8 [Planctomycetes bacterium]|nr:30S ribosomal protein S8 [Planctomycetota bacterium]
MSVTDPIADMLTRIRNSCMRKSENVDMPASKMKKAVAKVLKETGYIQDYKVTSTDKFATLRIYLKYSQTGESVINAIKRISKPGCRIYRGVDKLPKVLDSLGTSIVSTSKGVMSDKECKKLKLGGEVICQLW